MPAGVQNSVQRAFERANEVRREVVDRRSRGAATLLSPIPGPLLPAEKRSLNPTRRTLTLPSRVLRRWDDHASPRLSGMAVEGCFVVFPRLYSRPSQRPSLEAYGVRTVPLSGAQITIPPEVRRGWVTDVVLLFDFGNAMIVSSSEDLEWLSRIRSG